MSDVQADATTEPAPQVGEQAAAQPQEPQSTPAPAPEEKPIEYADFKIPEDVQIVPEILNNFKERAKALKLSQEDAQGFVDLMQDVERARSTHLQEAWAKQLDQWQTDAKNHPVYGKEKLDTSLGRIKIAVEQTIPDKSERESFYELLDTTGMGNHPSFILLLHKLANATLEDTRVGGTQGHTTNESKDLAKILYPTMQGKE